MLLTNISQQILLSVTMSSVSQLLRASSFFQCAFQRPLWINRRVLLTYEYETYLWSWRPHSRACKRVSGPPWDRTRRPCWAADYTWHTRSTADGTRCPGLGAPPVWGGSPARSPHTLSRTAWSTHSTTHRSLLQISQTESRSIKEVMQFLIFEAPTSHHGAYFSSQHFTRLFESYWTTCTHISGVRMFLG
jgi:hypothetical protein